MKNNTYVANFNITFGDDDEPLLTHFSDILLPAMQSNMKRVVDGDKYYFVNARVADVNSELVLTGFIVKETELEIKSKVVNNELTTTEEYYPAAPFSVFYIFLNNHRMALIKNQKGSPDIRSFRVTANKIITSYIKQANKDRTGNKLLPDAHINIMGIPSAKNWDSIFKGVKKVKRLNLTFFPLNGDGNHKNLTGMLIDELIKGCGTRVGHVTVGACNDIDGVHRLVAGMDGLMEAKLTLDYEERKDVDVDNNSVKEHYFMEGTTENLSKPSAMVPALMKIDSLSYASEENKSIYEKFREKFAIASMINIFMGKDDTDQYVVEEKDDFTN